MSANFTGFIEDTKNLKPILQSYSVVVPKILIDDTDNAIIIIYVTKKQIQNTRFWQNKIIYYQMRNK